MGTPTRVREGRQVMRCPRPRDGHPNTGERRASGHAAPKATRWAPRHGVPSAARGPGGRVPPGVGAGCARSALTASRPQTCPLLLRVFTTNNGRHHRMDEFSRGNVPSSELQIYTWMDATLKELTSLVKEVYPEARKKGTHFNFAIVFTDLKRPGYRVKEIGSTMSGRKGTDDSMTLQSQKFQIGDYLDIAITPPNRAPPPSSRMRPY
ncbi:PREDICTED: histone deacetylase complex subunit SAP18 [Tinamus guttatus]|uniref:histone deacetylase complex subunit SAP18 n=1 Tax=Tinamus guttatus TaxID=94827 RepID=UPI00052EC405|nr:PREDICTED: histone deacetylase complex subunit SAP18 [Tinamus guttatus]